ncbi:hypothetical protein BCR44DRAFT_1430068 [Catenaria anguillulae PL171]|uniref:Uncharacterized protein n=1 Tax=Catenaria anguillulae PL171 TaxID=765915 RepID=A0A1Y2HV75_9FUNG|nr:hypothetical protein BCR44DRAFT_1430068 [Catenaria anguillulae PL171]
MSGPIPDTTATAEPAAGHSNTQSQSQTQAQAHTDTSTNLKMTVVAQDHPSAAVDAAAATADHDQATNRFPSTVPFPPQTPVMHHPSAPYAAAAPGHHINLDDHDTAAMDIDHQTPRANLAHQQTEDPDQVMFHASGGVNHNHNHNGAAAGAFDPASNNDLEDDQQIPIFLSTPVQTQESGDMIERIQEENSRLRMQITRAYRQFEDIKAIRTTEAEAALRDHRELANARYEVSEARRLELEQLKTVYESRILDLERELSHFRNARAPQHPTTTTSSSTASASGPHAPTAPDTETDPAALALLKMSEHLTGLYLQMARPGVINCAQYPMDVPDGMDPEALTFAFQLIELPPDAAAADAGAQSGADNDEGLPVKYRYKPVRVPEHMANVFKAETEVEQEVLGKFYSRMMLDLVPADE